jgi:hypothetical protein
MKTACLFVLSCAAILLFGIPLRAQAPSILETTGDFPGGGHRWISAAAAADPEKIIDLDMIGSDFLRPRVEKQRQALGDRFGSEKLKAGEKPVVAAIPTSECRSTTVAMDGRGGIGSGATLADLAGNSEVIVRGKIRSVDFGFAFGIPTSLLGVEAAEILKGSALKSPFYIDYPVARFRIGPFSFCNLNKGFEPHPGDEILLFSYTGPGDRDGILYAPRLDQMLFQTQSGTLFIPSPLKETPEMKKARTLDDITSRLRSGRLFESPGK